MVQQTLIGLLLDSIRTLIKRYIHVLFSENYLQITCIDNIFLIEQLLLKCLFLLS